MFTGDWGTAWLRKNGQINLNQSNVSYKYEQCQEVTSQRLGQSKAGWSMWKDWLCAGEKYTLPVSHHSQIIMRLMILSVRADTALYCNWAFSGKCSMVVAIQQIWLYNVRVFSWKCRMDLAIFPWACLLLFLLLFSDGDGFLMLFTQPLELFESSWRLQHCSCPAF